MRRTKGEGVRPLALSPCVRYSRWWAEGAVVGWIIGSVLAAVVSALAAVACGLYIRFSGPIVASQELRAVQADLDATRAEWRAAKIQLETLAEAAANDADKANRLRARASAAASKAARLEAGPMDENEAAFARARAAGLI